MSGETVLVVEDETEFQSMYRSWLSDIYQVRTASTGQEALEMFDDEVDVVLLDRRLSGIDTVILLPMLRNRNPETSIGILTAVDPDDEVLRMDFDTYLTKPVHETEVLKLVEALCEDDKEELDRIGDVRA